MDVNAGVWVSINSLALTLFRTGMYNHNGLTDGSTAEEPAALPGGGLIVSMKK